jgi:hypothetical protein
MGSVQQFVNPCGVILIMNVAIPWGTLMDTEWDDLTRREQRVLIMLFGGGTLRSLSAEIVIQLSLRGLVDHTGLTLKGLRVFIAAFRQQEAAKRERLVA